MIIYISIFFSSLAVGQMHFLERPENQYVTPGKNATFHCQTRSCYQTYWLINDSQIVAPGSSITYTNLTIYISSEIYKNNTSVVCFCSVAGRKFLNKTAYLFVVSCLALPSAITQIRQTKIYMDLDGDWFARVIFEVPELCVDQSVNYTILIMDRDENAITSQGPTVYMGKEQVEEDISEGLLERNRTYWIQVEAMTALPEGRNLSEKMMIDTHLQLNMNTTCSNGNESIVQIRGLDKFEVRKSRDQLLVVVAVLGGLTGILMFVVIITCIGSFIILKKSQNKSGHNVGHASVRTMVTNPIYDGPMYESIHQNFSMACSPINFNTSATSNNESPTSPRYFVHTHNCEVAKQYANTPDSTASDVPLVPAVLPKTSKERNKLQLTLSLEPAVSNDTGGSATHTRLAATSFGGTKPDRDCSNEDNYTVMSPAAASDTQSGGCTEVTPEKH